MSIYLLRNISLFFSLSLFTVSCDNFKRFGQEKYICANNNLLIKQIYVITTNSVKKAYMLINDIEIPNMILVF